MFCGEGGSVDGANQRMRIHLADRRSAKDATGNSSMSSPTVACIQLAECGNIFRQSHEIANDMLENECEGKVEVSKRVALRKGCCFCRCRGLGRREGILLFTDQRDRKRTTETEAGRLAFFRQGEIMNLGRCGCCFSSFLDESKSSSPSGYFRDT